MPSRKLNPEAYTYGFNGQLTDAEWMGGQSVAFEFRTQDPRLGRFLSTDPLTALRPNQSPYAFAANNPIANIDYLGLIDSSGTGDGSVTWTGENQTDVTEAVVTAKKTPSTTDAYADHQNKMGQEEVSAGNHSELLSQDGGAGSASSWDEYYAQKDAFIKAQCGSCSHEDALDIYYTESGLRAADKDLRDKVVLGKLGFFADGFAQIGSVVGPGGGAVKPSVFRAGARPKLDLGAARGRSEAFPGYKNESVFSGVLNLKTGNLTYRPSGSTVTYSGKVPGNLVPRNRGHFEVLKSAGGSFKNNIAVTMFKGAGNRIHLEFKSTSVTRQFNRANKLGRSPMPSTHHQNAIIEAVRRNFPKSRISY